MESPSTGHHMEPPEPLPNQPMESSPIQQRMEYPPIQQSIESPPMQQRTQSPPIQQFMELPSKRQRTESPPKRRRLSSDNEEEYIRPTRDHRSARRRLQKKFKSKLESIFEKYSQDFTDIGDEIDLATGEVVVDNGHLLSMENETDLYAQEDAESDDPDAGSVNSSDDEIEVEHELQEIDAPQGDPGDNLEDVVATDANDNDSDFDSLLEEDIGGSLDSGHPNRTSDERRKDGMSPLPLRPRYYHM